MTADTIRDRLAFTDRSDAESFEADAVDRTFGADTYDNALRKSGRRRRRRGRIPFTKPAKKV